MSFEKNHKLSWWGSHWGFEAQGDMLWETCHQLQVWNLLLGQCSGRISYVAHPWCTPTVQNSHTFAHPQYIAIGFNLQWNFGKNQHLWLALSRMIWMSGLLLRHVGAFPAFFVLLGGPCHVFLFRPVQKWIYYIIGGIFKRCRFMKIRPMFPIKILIWDPPAVKDARTFLVLQH